MSQQWRTIESIQLSCEIIELLQEREAAGVTELADELGRSKSSIHAYLSTLAEQKYVVERDGLYSLSLKYIDLAEHVKNQVGKFDVIRAEIDELADATGEVAQFGTLEHGDLVYLYKARGDAAVETMSTMGSRETLHSTALGKAILSVMNEASVRDLLGPGPLPAKTDNTITDINELVDELEMITERGYAIDDEENILGLRCVSTPVVLDDGTVLGSISVSGPSSRMTTDWIDDELKETLERAANVVQINTKFS